MDYVFTLSQPTYPNDAETKAQLAEGREIARRALQAYLGGSDDHILAAWLACQADGGVPPLLCAQGDLSAAQLRWNNACYFALDVYYYGSSAEAAKASNENAEAYGETMEFSWVSVVPANVPAFRDKGKWQEAFLGRLNEMKYQPLANETPHGLAEWHWTHEGNLHPVCAADQVGIYPGCSSVQRAWAGQHAFYRELTEKLEHLPAPNDVVAAMAQSELTLDLI